MGKNIKALLIGVGNIGARYDWDTSDTKTYAKAFANDRDVSFDIYDPFAKNCLEVAERYRAKIITEFTKSNLSKYDLVVIASPTETHFAYLKKLIESNNFREDLFHRLAVIEIKIPTLSERKSDIKILSAYFIEQISNEQGLSKKKITKEAITALENYPWSGNIRELRNVIERLMILGENPISVENINMYASK